MAAEDNLKDSRNVTWLTNKGAWMAYALTLLGFHFFLMAVPLLSVPIVWTLTNVIHSIAAYVFFHYVKGTPFFSDDQGATRRLTHWEQMEEEGDELATSRIFFVAVPVILFILASFYTQYHFTHFIINLLALLVAVVPKLPMFHRYRFFQINKY